MVTVTSSINRHRSHPIRTRLQIHRKRPTRTRRTRRIHRGANESERPEAAIVLQPQLRITILQTNTNCRNTHIVRSNTHDLHTRASLNIALTRTHNRRIRILNIINRPSWHEPRPQLREVLGYTRKRIGSAIGRRVGIVIGRSRCDVLTRGFFKAADFAAADAGQAVDAFSGRSEAKATGLVDDA